MQAQVTLPQTSIEQIVEQIFTARKITRNDQDRLMLLFSDRSMEPGDLILVQQIHKALSKGTIRVVE